MQYTPGQLRHAVGLSKEAFRHWKRILPVFSGRKEHAPRFSPGDVLAWAVLRRLTESCGVRIGHLREVSSKIFDICNHTSWDLLADRVLILDLPDHECLTVAKSDRVPTNNAVVVCPLGPVIAKLQDDFLRSSRSPARELPPPAIRSATSHAEGESRP